MLCPVRACVVSALLLAVTVSLESEDPIFSWQAQAGLIEHDEDGQTARSAARLAPDTVADLEAALSTESLAAEEVLTAKTGTWNLAKEDDESDVFLEA